MPGPALIKTTEDADRAFIADQITRHFTSTTIRSIDNEYQADQLDGFIAALDGKRVGHITLANLGDEVEIPTLVCEAENQGIGAALLEAATAWAKQRGARRLFLTTSNDNLRALGFYQKRGFELVAVHRNGLMRQRELEPEIPRIAPNGIPIRDEIELEMRL